MSAESASTLRAALLCRCPKCCRGPLFEGFLGVPATCTACGLDYATFDPGDGPAVFVILIVGFVVVGLALWTEVHYMPPIWLHMVMWLPLVVILSLGLLRPLKALLMALQYRNKAAQHRAND